MSGLIERAMAWGAIWHGGQVRKYTDSVPYFTHPIRVAKMVAEVGATDEMIAAALLHDTVEDCGVTLKEIAEKFSPMVALLVSGLTDISKPEDGNRACRKEIDRQHMAVQPAEVKTIKLADLIDNSESIAKYDPEFANVYMREKSLLLEVLIEGNPVLYARAKSILDRYFSEQNP